MRTSLSLVFALWILAAAAAAARAAAPGPSPAERDLRVANERIEAATDPAARARARIALAIAHTRRAREIGDASHYQASLEALAQARRDAPGATDADKVEAWVRLGLHEFAAAESLARAWLAAHPDDPDACSLLGDALMEQGRSDEAASPYQRMMDLCPGPGAYLRAAYWRERAGDLAGSKDLLLRALGREGEAREQEGAFLREALAHVERPDNENLFLVDFYLDRRPDPARALAEREASRRRDPATLERLARARARVEASASAR